MTTARKGVGGFKKKKKKNQNEDECRCQIRRMEGLVTCIWTTTINS